MSICIPERSCTIDVDCVRPGSDARDAPEQVCTIIRKDVKLGQLYVYGLDVAREMQTIDSRAHCQTDRERRQARPTLRSDARDANHATGQVSGDLAILYDIRARASGYPPSSPSAPTSGLGDKGCRSRRIAATCSCLRRWSSSPARTRYPRPG
ncbi:hypothetical protein EXIGLDRAFT_41440 [Exidia glandulosa HHB12029]|uniref:Uncharacterized protein n=1 Tax=Exidia glandulosa HHB12029 TaxID=1314781 RepID=A0A165Z0J0_EXIGL|nr:hypothetical protein EXIGLDRAFT_41440 [Exidia glandulosa HHB12029]